jgi:putative ABC transport system substrate-binding protein
MAREVGFLVAATTSDWAPYITWFKARLTTPNVNITFLPPGGAAGDLDKISEAAKYLAKNSEVIVTAGTQAALICKAETKTTPFVFASVGDPAISGLSPQPGGNFTGCSNQQVKLVPQRVDEMLAHQFQGPFAVVGNYQIPIIQHAMMSAFSVLIAKGMQAQLAPITPQDDLDTFISGLKGQGIKSLYVCSDPAITTRSTALNAKAHAGRAASRLKTMFEFSEHVTQHGGDLSYGINFKDLFEKAAEYVDRILSGTKAGDLPIFEPPPSDRELVEKKKSLAYPTKKGRPSQTKKKSRRGR